MWRVKRVYFSLSSPSSSDAASAICCCFVLFFSYFTPSSTTNFSFVCFAFLPSFRSRANGFESNVTNKRSLRRIALGQSAIGIWISPLCDPTMMMEDKTEEKKRKDWIMWHDFLRSPGRLLKLGTSDHQKNVKKATGRDVNEQIVNETIYWAEWTKRLRSRREFRFFLHS